MLPIILTSQKVINNIMRAKEFTAKIREDDDVPDLKPTAQDRIPDFTNRPSNLAPPKYPVSTVKDYLGRIEPSFGEPATEPTTPPLRAIRPSMPSAPPGDPAAQELFRSQAKVFGLNPQAPAEPAPAVTINPADRPAPPRGTTSTGKTKIEPSFSKGGGGGGFIPGDDDALGMNKWEKILR
jgi:hypothetical protein